MKTRMNRVKQREIRKYMNIDSKLTKAKQKKLILLKTFKPLRIS